jgi:predicted PhzF superfamily epimerase YddE/YHI9
VLDERLGRLGLTRQEVVDAAWIDNGPGWMGVLLASADAVLAVTPPDGPAPGFDVGLAGFHPIGADWKIEVRAFFADATGTVREDPVTGSLNASLAQWLSAAGRVTAPYVARQGTVLGRAGRIFVDAADGDLWIGGATTVTISGEIDVGG